MSEFLKQLQARLQTKKEGVGDALIKNSNTPNSTPQNKRSSFLGKLKVLCSSWLRQLDRLDPKPSHISGASLSKTIKPITLANTFTYAFMLLTAAITSYWLLRIAQIPNVPALHASGISKGMTLYSNQDNTTAYSLFGSKPLVTDNILLRGVVITSRGADGHLDGFAIFEVDGKPTNAISIGESLGKGLILYGIGDESATLLYEGQKLDFKLSKTGAPKK